MNNPKAHIFPYPFINNFFFFIGVFHDHQTIKQGRMDGHTAMNQHLTGYTLNEDTRISTQYHDNAESLTTMGYGRG